MQILDVKSDFKFVVRKKMMIYAKQNRLSQPKNDLPSEVFFGKDEEQLEPHFPFNNISI